MSVDEAGPVSADDGDPVSADEAGPVRADDGEPLGGDEDEAAIPQAIPVLIEETADLEPPVEVVAVGATTEYRVAGRVFAVATERIFEVDLGAEVASAAVRTPDAGASGRGPGWVRFAPPAVDDHAADRIVSWFELARRIAAGRRPSAGREGRA